ncbi:hypothetical protein CSC2_13870 [Clostridium zeae]|uniref:NADPH-dependent FMN reductase-like domain-containing protein n=1 Tax=Clostridium zeae TaxID=2759022 RepID=A0ABQ1E859_9CLOT|nr:flavodoxin family protein [Clostridium zeae]GFZ30861.1 hypothetical protein CSC2_13870 [Clostridium zeae]
MDKIRILMINGTQASKEKIGFKRGKSNTGFVFNHIENRLRGVFPNCDIETLLLNDYNIVPCNSCAICCVPGGKCPLQDMPDDSVEFIVNKMLDADVIVFGVPVYCMGIPGKTKSFFDRLAEYFHIPKFIAKPCISVTTYNLSDELAKLFMSKAFKMLGSQYIGNLSASVLGDAFGNLLIDNMDDFEVDLSTILSTLKKVVDKEITIEPSESDKAMFEKVKQRWINNKRYTKVIYKYWKERGLLDAEYYY